MSGITTPLQVGMSGITTPLQVGMSKSVPYVKGWVEHRIARNIVQIATMEQRRECPIIQRRNSITSLRVAKLPGTLFHAPVVGVGCN
jgi:hypothetical protein